MEIKYMQLLKENPVIYPQDPEDSRKIRGLSIERIKELENKYTNGKPFPKALIELLYLAGDYCYLLNRPHNTEEKNQDISREGLAKYNISISRPFFVIDVTDNGRSQFMYIHLDKGDNPHVYEAFLLGKDRGLAPLSIAYKEPRLSEYINNLIQINKERGYL